MTLSPVGPDEPVAMRSLITYCDEATGERTALTAPSWVGGVPLRPSSVRPHLGADVSTFAASDRAAIVDGTTFGEYGAVPAEVASPT